MTRDPELSGIALWAEKTHGDRGADHIASQVARHAEHGDESGIAMWSAVADRHYQLRERNTVQLIAFLQRTKYEHMLPSNESKGSPCKSSSLIWCSRSPRSAPPCRPSSGRSDGNGDRLQSEGDARRPCLTRSRLRDPSNREQRHGRSRPRMRHPNRARDPASRASTKVRSASRGPVPGRNRPTPARCRFQRRGVYLKRGRQRRSSEREDHQAARTGATFARAWCQGSMRIFGSNVG